jgi:hypothetical protein
MVQLAKLVQLFTQIFSSRAQLRNFQKFHKRISEISNLSKQFYVSTKHVHAKFQFSRVLTRWKFLTFFQEKIWIEFYGKMTSIVVKYDMLGCGKTELLSKINDTLLMNMNTQ